MTNFEFIKELNIDELSDFYCHKMDGLCFNSCPFEKICYENGNKKGIYKWLSEEHKGDKYGW